MQKLHQYVLVFEKVPRAGTDALKGPYMPVGIGLVTPVLDVKTPMRRLWGPHWSPQEK